MNALTQPAALDVAPAASIPEAVESATREGVLEIPGAFKLHLGGHIDQMKVAWRLVGDDAAPVVAALGGISAGRFVTGNTPRGWWSEIVGPGSALDTRRCRVLGFDFLGGSGQTTGPRRDQSNFPSISAYDQAAVLAHLIEHLKLGSVQAVVGASYGGMVALAFAERFPQLTRRIVVISAADRSHPMATAWRSVQRATVRYALKKNDGPEGLRLARALAMATYRSPAEFAVRFDAEPERIDGRFQFPVETYLLARGDAYAASYLPEAFLCLSESIDLHRVDPARITVPTTLVAVREDQLVPLCDVQRLQSSLAGPAEIVEISSLYGHDAFLKEGAVLQPVFERALGFSEQAR
ncbi:homoserine O-acetyltransferase [Povalibacter uvarum]|uniref:Homoserine O-acetyltransferase n=1 Tax=Povalibacter uvarum TaxID=732238 RepID=A0A841HGN3_9GAMM|nr:homoserine O-succinyltransferase [Povalibacter uvarum]MBB6092057.1 homoserine O-acetyltransferase [Povalibacter uvarum]